MKTKKNDPLKLVKNLLDFSISKDETRPQLNGFYHDEILASVVAVNGHIATISPSLYNPKLKNVIISKNYDIIDRDYPKISSIIPQKITDKYIVEFKAIDVNFKKNDLKKNDLKKNDLKTKAYFYENGVDELNRKIISITYERPESFLFILNPYYLSKFTAGHQFVIRYFGEKLPVIFELGEQFDDIFLVMPLMP
jgi:hypothetical protein